MCNLYERIENLCKKRGVSVTQLCRATGIPRSNLSELKMGRQQTINAASIAKIADYFGVSVDYLLGAEEKENSSEAEASELSDEALMAARIIDRLPPEGRRLILAQMQAAERELLTQDGGQEFPESQ